MGRGTLPCKDVGGRWGYAELLEQSMPKATVTQLDDWVEEDFDPNIVDADELAEAVMALARRWSRNAPYHPTNLVFDRHFFSGYQRDRLITAVYLGV